MTPADPVRTPAGAIAWSPRSGYLHDPQDVARHEQDGELVLVVSDGWLHDLEDDTLAGLARIDAEYEVLFDTLTGGYEDMADRLGRWEP